VKFGEERPPLIAYSADDRRMANGSDQVSTKSLVDTKRKPVSVGRRREWPEALKRQMVAETLEADASGRSWRGGMT
jgi:hypothetical protein